MSWSTDEHGEGWFEGRPEQAVDTLNMSPGERSDWMGTDPYRWAQACIQHAKVAGPATGEDADEAMLGFMATWFANAMMAKAEDTERACEPPQQQEVQDNE